MGLVSTGLQRYIGRYRGTGVTQGVTEVLYIQAIHFQKRIFYGRLPWSDKAGFLTIIDSYNEAILV